MVVNSPSANWLSDLRTQLKAFVSGVCSQSKRFFFSTVFSNEFIASSRHLKELKLKENLLDRPQIWTIVRLTYQINKYLSANFLFHNIFSPRTIFARSLHVNFISSYFENVVSFHCSWIWQNAYGFLLALFVLKPLGEKNKLAKNKNSLWLVTSKR